MLVRPGSIGKLTDALRETPTAVALLGVLVLFAVWASDQTGYPVTHWAPGALIVLGLLAGALSSVRLRLADVDVRVRLALACLALYTALSFVSIAWAQVPADAWEGANRTLLYLLVFALFVLWPQRSVVAAALLVAWTLAMIVLAAFVLLHLDGVSSLAGLFHDGRLKYPAGYENANAATWAMVLWPALLLAACERMPWGARGALAAGTVLLADLALLSQSRGSFYATAIMLILVFALVPGRLRTFAVLVPLAAGIGLSAPAVLRVSDRLLHGGDVRAALHGAIGAAFLAALLVGLLVALGAALESRLTFSEISIRRARTVVGAIASATLVAVLAGGWAAAGDPLARLEHGWATFKRGYSANRHTGSRLTSGLGSNRYDFYRVALDEFRAHPLLGIGADNFQQQYLLHGRSHETPHYPHSLELRTLTQTGLAGTSLALIGLAAALLAGARAALSRSARRADPLGAGVAAASLAGFAYWLVHGSFDWFWEFAGLGAPAFALLGLACGLAPGKRRGAPTVASTAAAVSTRRRVGTLVGIVAALAAAGSLAAPWLSQLQVQSAAQTWTTAPRNAYHRLDEAARLNPLSDEPYLVEGSIALRFGDLALADRAFSRALARTPGDAYATLERGAIASARGDSAHALGFLERAARLNPRDPPTRLALGLARAGQRVSIGELNRSILLRSQQFR
jgi:hypothetical protein